MILEIKSPLAYFSPLFADELFCAPRTGTGASLSEIKRLKKFRKGAYLFEVGEMAYFIYRLIEGRARLSVYDGSRKAPISRLIEPDEVLGLPEAICGIPYQIDARAITPCTCEFVGREDLIRFLLDKPEAASRLAKVLGSNLQNSYRLFSSQ